MRTKEQINNLRSAFCRMYTPLAVFWSNDAVDFLGDKIQDGVNKSAQWTWEIRVFTATNIEDTWKDVKPEPKTPYCTVDTIKKKCQELLNKYPLILSILVVAKENQKLVFEFNSY